MRPPRRLSTEEAALWRKVAETVTPLERRRLRRPSPPAGQTDMAVPVASSASSSVAPSTIALSRADLAAALARPRKAREPQRSATSDAPPQRLPEQRIGLDASWERRIIKGALDPDFALDLHGTGLDGAYVRLMQGLTQAKALGARLVLVVTGKPRPVAAADRGHARGAIRAKISDWLAASEHAGDIAAVRGAHVRHGGQGAIYIVLKRRR